MASFNNQGIDPATVSAVTIRASAGGSFVEPSAGTGATLYVWRAFGEQGSQWLAVESNTLGSTLDGYQGGVISWTTTDADLIRSLLIDDKVYMQLRPAGQSSLTTESSVTLDYIELRLHYQTP